MSSNRRRRRRRRGSDGSGQSGAAPRSRRRGLRATIDSFGGFTTIGAGVVGVLIVVVLIALNRPGGDGVVGGGEYVLRERSAPSSGRLLGDPDAPVRLIAYEDFSCSHCGDFTEQTEPQIEEEFVEPGLVSIEYRDMAILGEDSERAAAAASCAADQDRFWEYHDILFLRQARGGWASSGNLKDFAREVDAALTTAGQSGLDLDTFDACVDDGTHEAAVATSTDEAAALFTQLVGTASTPSFMIDGRPLVGAQGIEVFRDAIEAALPDDEGG